MSNRTIERKAAFRIIGFKTALNDGTGIHAPQYSGQKTVFFKRMIETGGLAGLRPYAESPYGCAAIAQDDDGSVYYYAGVISSRTLPEQADEVRFAEGEYLVLSEKGGLSRLAFDRLEDEAFGSVLSEAYEYEYTGGPVAEVLLNGNPSDAEVEVWVPVRKR